ncbi:MAG: hypothetical protein CSB34_07225 [Desulfobulbus propionicus]|nr:MAG: hypothetical protein CSB34_07225 [Desulfobulbus propionicus]
MSKFFIILGAVFLCIGIGWPWLKHLPLGRLPGDITLVREHFRLYFPITTSVIISLLLSLLLWLFKK